MNKVHRLYFDIETWGGQNKPSLDDIEAPSNYKDPEKILDYKQDKLEGAWAKQALNPLKGEIICIGYAIDDTKPFFLTGDEAFIVRNFETILSDLDYIHWVGYNILGFDIPWLYMRAIKYGCTSLKLQLPRSKADHNYTDLMQSFSSTLYGKDSYMSMKDVAAFLGVKAKTDMDGSMVHQAFVDGGILQIAGYCMEDVEVTRKLYKLIKND